MPLLCFPHPAPQAGASPCPRAALPHTTPWDKGSAGPGSHDGQKNPPRAAPCGLQQQLRVQLLHVAFSHDNRQEGCSAGAGCPVWAAWVALCGIGVCTCISGPKYSCSWVVRAWHLGVFQPLGPAVGWRCSLGLGRGTDARRHQLGTWQLLAQETLVAVTMVSVAATKGCQGHGLHVLSLCPLPFPPPWCYQGGCQSQGMSSGHRKAGAAL